MCDSQSCSPDAAERARLLDAVERAILADIPLARTMRLRAQAYDGNRLVFAAALAPNVNDKGCAFGGSLTSLMTLVGWGLIKLALDASARDCDLYVRDSQVRYLAPVWQDFEAVAVLGEGQSFSVMFDTLDARGRAGIDVRCHVPLADGSEAATLKARFVGITRR